MHSYVNRLEVLLAKVWPKSFDSPLVRNGYSLVASAGITSILGLVFWMIAARLFTPTELGISVGLLSALQTIGQIGQLNFGNVLNRFLPVSGRRTANIIILVYTSAALLAFCLALGTVAAIDYLLPELAMALNNGTRVALFVAAVVLWTLFALQDSALAGLRMGTAVPLENGVYAVAKIAMLAVFAGTFYADVGIFLAWIAPLPIIVLLTNLYIFARVIPRRADPGHDPSESALQTILRFFGWDYAGTLAMSLAMGVAPLIVLNTAGTTAVATYHLAWTIAYSLYLIGRSMGVSLLTEAVADRQRLPAMFADTVIYTFLPMTVGIILTTLAAPWIMGLFGAVYAEHGTLLLQLLAVSCLPWGITTIYLSYARAAGHFLEIAALQIISALLLIVFSIPLLSAYGTEGIGVASLAAHSIVCIGVLFAAVRKNGWKETQVFLLRLITSLARFAETVRSALGRGKSRRIDERVKQQLLEQAKLSGGANWHELPLAPSKSDVLSVKLAAGHSSEGRRHDEVFYKSARSEKGRQSLERLTANLARIRAHPQFSAFPVSVPRTLAMLHDGGALNILESSIGGIDGQHLAPGLARAQRALILGQAASTISELHALTASTTTIGHGWCDQWVTQPARSLEGATSVLLSGRRRASAIERFIAEQTAFWLNQDVLLGCGHRDYSLGNIVFGEASEKDEPAHAVAGIIDWESAVDDAPVCIDICHLAITSTALFRAEELGHQVRRLLDEPRLITDSGEWLNNLPPTGSFPQDWVSNSQAARSVVGLAWLQHVSVTMQKSERYRNNKVWCLSNIDWVLKYYADGESKVDSL